jgi:3-oxoacyl-[acyl-carrier protein] reductase
MTHVLVKELGHRAITVNAVAPGPVETDLFTTGKSDAQIESIARMIPLGRLGQPNDIAGLVSFWPGRTAFG